jgi:hypothetical protein
MICNCRAIEPCKSKVGSCAAGPGTEEGASRGRIWNKSHVYRAAGPGTIRAEGGRSGGGDDDVSKRNGLDAEARGLDGGLDAPPVAETRGGQNGLRDVVQYEVGDRVMARWKGGEYYPGEVATVNKDGSYLVQFDDGDVEEAEPHGHMVMRSLSCSVLYFFIW